MFNGLIIFRKNILFWLRYLTKCIEIALLFANYIWLISESIYFDSFFLLSWQTICVHVHKQEVFIGFQQQFTFWKMKGTIFNIVSFLCYFCLLELYNVYVHCSLLSSGECSIDKCPEETFFKLNRSNYLFLFLKLWSVFFAINGCNVIYNAKLKRVGSAFWH